MVPNRATHHILSAFLKRQKNNSLSIFSKVLRKKELDYTKRKSRRTVFHIYVIGARGVGKTSFMQRFLNNDIEDNKETKEFSKYVINSVQLKKQEIHIIVSKTFPEKNYLFKINNRNTWKNCETSRTIKAPTSRQWRRYDVLIVNFEHFFPTFHRVSIVHFEQLNVCWVVQFWDGMMFVSVFVKKVQTALFFFTFTDHKFFTGLVWILKKPVKISFCRSSYCYNFRKVWKKFQKTSFRKVKVLV